MERGPARCSSIARGLKELAEAMLTRAKAAPGTRETAITLLAADALLTFALEAASESEPQRLADFC